MTEPELCEFIYYPLQVFIIDWFLMFVNQTQVGADFNGSQLAKMKKSIPDMSLP